MSGIYGLFQRDGSAVAEQTLALLAGAMRDWEVDRSGQQCNGAVGLGHLLLHATAESCHQPQPVAHPARPELWITADARLDNRAELFVALGLSQPQQQLTSDALLILHAYARWGASCVRRLLGDFAFAIWDGYRQEFFCARDQLGIKPFYYSLQQGLFVFASDLRAVLAHPAVPRRLNEALLAFYLQELSPYAEKCLTFYEDVLKLPAAHYLVVGAQQVHRQQYWSVDYIAPLRYADDAEYEEQLRHLLHEAVACRLGGAASVGAHLSGGLDSSTIAVLAARQLRARGQQLSAFSWSPPPAAGATLADERRVIAEICTREGISCSYLEWRPEHYLESCARDFTVQPREMLLRELQVQRAARKAGIGVLLSGWGGDEGISFNGRGYLAELLLRGRLRAWLAEVRARPARGGRLGPLTSLVGPIYRQTLLPLLPAPLLQLLRQERRLTNRKYMNQGFAHRYRAEVRRLRGPSARPQPGLHRMQRLLFNNGHLTARCESWAISGAQHHIEYRYPLLDRRIVEFALAVPADQYYRAGRRRDLFRRASAAILPAQAPGHDYKGENGSFALLVEILLSIPAATRAPLSAISVDAPAAAYINIANVLEAARNGPPPDEWVFWERALSCLWIDSLQEAAPPLDHS